MKNDKTIQGLVSIKDNPDNLSYHLNLAESAPNNYINNEYSGVGGHLFAIACKKSFESGYGGFIYFEAKNQELIEHYQEVFGATLFDKRSGYRMFIDEQAAKELVNMYNLEEVI